MYFESLINHLNIRQQDYPDDSYIWSKLSTANQSQYLFVKTIVEIDKCI